MDGADVNVKNNSEQTPLHLAAKSGNKEAVVALLGKDEIDVNATDKNGETPLHWAAERGNKEVVQALLDGGANVNLRDKNQRTPSDLTTNKEIKALLEHAKEHDDGSVGGSSTDNEVNPKENAGTQQKKEVGEANQESEITKQEADKTVSSESGTPQAQQGGQPTTSAGKGTDVETKGVESVTPTEPAQTEEQPSSFFGSLFSILMKPFSLIASFFGGFFSWLFGSNEEKADESTSQTDADVSSPKTSLLDEKKIVIQTDNHSSLESVRQIDELHDDNQLLR